jgi:transposase
MSQRVAIELTVEERQMLQQMSRKGKASAREIYRARILLMSASGQSDAEIRAALGVSQTTVWRTRKHYAEGGLAWALHEQPRPGGKRKLNGLQEAYLVALACSEAPSGRDCWTMQLLADRLVELGIVETISDETVRSVLKKRSQTLAQTDVVYSQRE